MQIEILLGLWLLTGRARLTAWCVAVGVFTLFAGVSLASALNGQSDCGCFGPVKINPWLTFALDSVCLTALIFIRPMAKALTFVGPVFIALMLAVSIVVMIWAAETRDGARLLARLRGQSVGLRSSVVQVGSGPAHVVRSGTLRVENYSNQPVRLIGHKTTCSCTLAHGIPTTIQAGEFAELSIEVVPTGTPGQYVHRVELFTDAPGQPKLIGQITGTVTEPNP